MYIRKMPIKTTTANLNMLAYLDGGAPGKHGGRFKPAKVCPLKGDVPLIDIPLYKVYMRLIMNGTIPKGTTMFPMNQGFVNFGARQHFQINIVHTVFCRTKSTEGTVT